MNKNLLEPDIRLKKALDTDLGESKCEQISLRLKDTKKHQGSLPQKQEITT